MHAQCTVWDQACAERRWLPSRLLLCWFSPPTSRWTDAGCSEHRGGFFLKCFYFLHFCDSSLGDEVHTCEPFRPFVLKLLKLLQFRQRRGIIQESFSSLASGTLLFCFFFCNLKQMTVAAAWNAACFAWKERFLNGKFLERGMKWKKCWIYLIWNTLAEFRVPWLMGQFVIVVFFFFQPKGHLLFLSCPRTNNPFFK